MKILGIDPGTATVGWGVIETEHQKGGKKYPKVLSCGIISTKSGTPDADRLEIIYDSISAIIKKERPSFVALEQLFFFKNQKTVMTVSQSRGAIILAIKKSKTPFFEFTPLQVKQAICGYGRADKNQMGEMVKVLFHLKIVPKPDDAVDALAVALCAAQTQKTIINNQSPITSK